MIKKNLSDQISWIKELKRNVPVFLNNLEEKSLPGFFHYSLSGDIYDKETHWGLGNTVFAIKIYYTFDLLSKISPQKKEEMASFIQSFQKNNGIFSDPLVKRLSLQNRILNCFKKGGFQNLLNNQTELAETRQSLSALKLIKYKPNKQFLMFPKTREEIEKYLHSLSWNHPWSAGSHFSHLLFFLGNSEIKDKEDLVNFAIDWVNKIQKENGAWYQSSTSRQEMINGAMKIITGLKAAGLSDKINNPQRLIDLCLDSINDSQACDNFNIIYVLKYASIAAGENYRLNEIRQFALRRLEKFKEFYHPEGGGFSFHRGESNKSYYGAVITKGKAEPDIHGTALFCWGISIISQILGINDKLGLKEFIA